MQEALTSVGAAFFLVDALDLFFSAVVIGGDVFVAGTFEVNFFLRGVVVVDFFLAVLFGVDFFLRNLFDVDFFLDDFLVLISL